MSAAWIRPVPYDDVVVERALAGTHRGQHLTDHDRTEVVRRALARGVTKKDIERLTGINPFRYRHLFPNDLREDAAS